MKEVQLFLQKTVLEDTLNIIGTKQWCAAAGDAHRSDASIGLFSCLLFVSNKILSLFSRLFGNSGACSACGQTIPASEFVMRAGGPQGAPAGPSPNHVFHLKCFACSKCGAQLVPGDRYYLLAGTLVCEQDWHKLLKNTPQGGPPTPTPPVRKGKVGRPRRSRDWEPGSRGPGRPPKLKPSEETTAFAWSEHSPDW